MPLQIIRNTIINVQADAIVNSANPAVAIGDGVDRIIYEAAGVEALFSERKKVGALQPGEVAITPAFALQAKYIIHTVGPIWCGGNEKELEQLEACYTNALQLAEKQHCNSIAFPLISTGTYGFPKDKALQIAITTISAYLLQNDLQIYLVVYDQESFQLSGKLFQGIQEYIDQNYINQTFSIHKERTVNRYFPRERRNRKSEIAARPAMMSMPMEEPLCQSYSLNLEEMMMTIGETFQQRLLRLIDEKKLSDVEVYKKANIDRKLFSKIRCNVEYRPKKRTALALAIALELNLDDTKDLLRRAEIALSPSIKFDLILQYFIEHEVYDIYTINLALFEHEQPLLGE